MEVEGGSCGWLSVEQERTECSVDVCYCSLMLIVQNAYEAHRAQKDCTYGEQTEIGIKLVLKSQRTNLIK